MAKLSAHGRSERLRLSKDFTYTATGLTSGVHRRVYAFMSDGKVLARSTWACTDHVTRGGWKLIRLAPGVDQFAAEMQLRKCGYTEVRIP